MMIAVLSVACLSMLLSLAALWRILRLEKRVGDIGRKAMADGTLGGGIFKTLVIENQDVDDDKSYQNDDTLFMERLDELIAANISRHDLNVDFLAAGMMVSRSLLFNRVHRTTGKGIVEYVNALRIEHSIELFADENRSLTEIAELCGFSTLRYYSRVFKSLKGEIPSTYREQLLRRKRLATTA